MQVSEIQVGQRIAYKGDMANASGRGVVVLVRPGGQVFDVLLDDGRKFIGVYASNVGGEFGNKSCRFMFNEGKAGADEIAGLQANSAIKAAQLKAKAEAVAAEFAKAMAAAKLAGQAIGLTPAAEFKGRGSAAASNLRKELKAAGIKASVVQPSYSSISVRVDDKDIKAAEAIGNKYEGGSFNGMTDCYDYDPSAWGKVFGDVDYVFVYRSGDGL